VPKIVDHAQRRHTIARAALDVVASGGMSELTLQAVAVAAGCSTGMVNHYFSNKHALIVAAAKEACKRFHDGFFTRPLPEGEGPQHLVQLLLAMLPVTDPEQPAHRVFVHLYSEGMNDPMVAEIARTFLDDARGHIDAVLRQGQLEGWVRGDIDPARTSRVLASAVDGLGIWTLLNGQANHQPPLEEHVDVILELVATVTATASAPTSRRAPTVASPSKGRAKASQS
jgi:AcrR family transcriptional regulator